MFRLQDIGRAEDEQSEVEFEHYTPLSDSELDIEEVWYWPSPFGVNGNKLRVERRFGENEWIGASKPTFRFVNLKGPSPDEKVNHSITINMTSSKKTKLESNDYTYLRDIEWRSRCVITAGPEPSLVQDANGNWVIANEAYNPRQDMNFFGTREQIATAVKGFDEGLDQAEEERVERSI